jgi:hypothetical protein
VGGGGGGWKEDEGVEGSKSEPKYDPINSSFSLRTSQQVKKSLKYERELRVKFEGKSKILNLVYILSSCSSIIKHLILCVPAL